jgi:cytochrome c biogenesis protein CcmG/thiol:disulfide interchange protein DsbE
MAVAMVLLAGCSRGSPDDGAAPTPIVAVNATIAPLLPTTANALPSMDVAGFDALMMQLRGTPVVVNVWATWCEPCTAEAPRLRAAHERYGDLVQFIGVDILDARGGAAAFISDYGISYPSVFDPAAAIRDSLGQFVQPVTAFYDRDGTQRHVVAGEISRDDLEAGIQAIVQRH